MALLVMNGSIRHIRPNPNGDGDYRKYISKRIKNNVSRKFTIRSSGEGKKTHPVPNGGDEYRDYVARQVQKRVNLQRLQDQERLVRIVRLEVEKLRIMEEHQNTKKEINERLYSQLYEDISEHIKINETRAKLIIDEKYEALMKDLDELETSIKSNKIIIDDEADAKTLSSANNYLFFKNLYEFTRSPFPLKNNNSFYFFIAVLLACTTMFFKT